MLQQTQTDRVIPKYEAFLKKFPDFPTLAQASLAEVLQMWQGLGYNRRAKYLKQCAEVVVKDHAGKLPMLINELKQLPGIGDYTAAAVAVFAFNRPVAVIETNIRSVYLHHFFPDEDEVSDQQLIALIEQTVDQINPREWYYALMDYGVYLKKTYGNANRRSKHYTKQSTFEGSDRQIRGKILKLLLTDDMTGQELDRHIQDERLGSILGKLAGEGMVREKGGKYVVG
jgi:A/G-specific adenine glycosylase